MRLEFGNDTVLSWPRGFMETKASDARRLRHLVKCYERSEEFLKGSISQRKIEKDSKKNKRSERIDARMSHTSR